MKSVTPTFRELIEILKPMPWKQRLEYLWTYYKIVPILLLCAVMLASIVANSIRTSRIETLHSGVLFGVTVSEEGEKAISHDLLALFEGDGVDRVVKHQSIVYMGGEDASLEENNRAAAMKLTVKVAAQELDYVIFGENGFQAMVQPEGYYEDLRNVLSQQQIETLSDRFIWTEKTETMESYPVALDISQTEFAKCCIYSGETLYLTFPIAGPNGERTPLFVDHLLNWKP